MLLNGTQSISELLARTGHAKPEKHCIPEQPQQEPTAHAQRSEAHGAGSVYAAESTQGALLPVTTLTSGNGLAPHDVHRRRTIGIHNKTPGASHTSRVLQNP